MPLYEYECYICHYKEDFIEKSSEDSGFISPHLCPKCLLDCPKWVKVDELTGELKGTSGTYDASYVSKQDGKSLGASVAMRRNIGTSNIHSTGYSVQDARYSRGKGGTRC